MKAIILAAGVGSRLRPMTARKPKCLVRVAGKPILRYQLDAYIKAGINEVIIVTGYESQAVIDYCKHLRGIKVTIIRNDDYESTNNMYSFYLASKLVDGESFLLSNGDVAIDPAIVVSMVNSRDASVVAVDRGVYDDESMKVAVSANGTIETISKGISSADAYGCSADFYKFSKGDSSRFCATVRQVIEIEKNLKDWTEVALDRLFKAAEMKFWPHLINGMRWLEVDNYSDLAAADKLFSPIFDQISDIEILFVDLDGTVYLGGEEISGAVEALNRLMAGGIETVFLSNNSSQSKNYYLERLVNLGLAVTAKQITLSTDGMISYLKANGVSRIWPLGTSAFTDELKEAGFVLDPASPEYVVVGYDTELTYEKLKYAALLIGKGIDYLATHRDLVCPTPEGPIPDIGSILALLKTATGREPVKIFGKPDSSMVDHVLAEKGVPPERAAVIGDRMYTDVALARTARCKAILVLSGETSREAVEDHEFFPDLIVDSVTELAS